jgi:pyrroloquinoline quinone biosynthesis protein D
MIVPAEVAVTLVDVPEVSRAFRLQFEEAQSAWVLLYPEGMVRLSNSAGEIMRRVDGARSVDALIRSLESAFPGADLQNDVLEFLREALGRGWITVRR